MKTKVMVRFPRMARIAVAAGTLGLVAGSVACGASSDGGKGAESGGDNGGLVGNPAPDFSVQAVTNGKGAVSLKALRGKVVLVDFWGTFCEPCK
jgi:thiol-disulfide isomerase/thioredoxin